METRAPYALIGLFVLTVIVAAFGFVYWLHNSGGLTERTVYRIQFENTVAGLLTGAAVLFNGIRVGEVTALELDANIPNRVTATIAVATTTPVRADTKVGLDFQGLTGVPVVTLQGGSIPLAASQKPHTQPYTLVADPLAGQSMTNAARDALKRLDSILSDNSEPIRSTIANLNTFSGALARNSDKLDEIVAGLARLTGGSAGAARVVFDLTAPKNFPPLSKTPESQLTIAEPTALLVFESRKIPVRPSGDEDSTFANAEWTDSIPKLVHSEDRADVRERRASESGFAPIRRRYGRPPACDRHSNIPALAARGTDSRSGLCREDRIDARADYRRALVSGRCASQGSERCGSGGRA